jgi:simple sugar transport system ATP-binding protein
VNATRVPSPASVVEDREIPALAARSVTKRFGHTLANDAVDLAVFPHQVHALLGENGAGKSTLVKILYGYIRADDGEVLFEGRPSEMRTPADARRLGIGMVFQHSTLIPAFTVAENVALFLPRLDPIVDLDAIESHINDVSTHYGLKVDPRRRAGHLSVGEQQRAEVVKLLVASARILIFDEPTSLLTAQEIDALFEVFAQLRRDGYPILFITHKLHEVLAVSDRITVMRKGRVVGTVATKEATEQEVVALMFGESKAKTSVPRPSEPSTGKPLVELRSVATYPTDGVPLQNVDLIVRPGEIVGIAGVSGNGQRELGNVILGIQALQSGTRHLFGNDATNWSVRRIRDAGVGYIPENPMGTSLIAGMTVAENMALSAPTRFSLRGGLEMDWRAVERALIEAFKQLDLDPLPPSMRVNALSGGNGQRFAFVRELYREPMLLIAAYPTKGLDVPTVAGVQRLLMTARQRGAGVLLISHDLNELKALSDRLLVLRSGRVVGEVDPDTADPYNIGLLMTGGGERDGRHASAMH